MNTKSKSNESSKNYLACDSEIRDYDPRCRFCPELRGDIVDSDFHRSVGLSAEARYIRETERFVAFPALGELTDGHLLIAPKCHRVAIAKITNASALAELENFIDDASKELHRFYGHPPLIFEHGMMNIANRAGCCVDHAHLHLVPVSVTIRARLISLHTKTTKLDRLAALADCTEGSKSYLYVREPGEPGYVYFPLRVPPQYLRRLVAKEMGTPNRWDWHSCLDISSIERVCEVMRPWRNIHGAPYFTVDSCVL